MIENDLTLLGARIAQLRFARRLKQSELAYEVGVSLRTLQRLEAGHIVRSDVLLKVIAGLGKLDSVMSALETAGFSPYEMLANAGISPAKLQDRPSIPLEATDYNPAPEAEGEMGRGFRKRRVRRPAEASSTAETSSRTSAQSVTVLWPEDK